MDEVDAMLDEAKRGTLLVTCFVDLKQGYAVHRHHA